MQVEKIDKKTLKYAVRFFIIACVVMTGIILSFYYYYDFISSTLFSEIFTALIYVVIVFCFFATRFRKPISKHKIKLRLKKFNWIYLLISLIPAAFKIYDGYTGSDSDEILFGFVKEDYAQGFGYILVGIVLLNRTILIDKKAINLNNLSLTEFDYSQFESISFTEQSVKIRADLKEFNYKIYKLSEQEVSKIHKMIEEFRPSTII